MESHGFQNFSLFEIDTPTSYEIDVVTLYKLLVGTPFQGNMLLNFPR